MTTTAEERRAPKRRARYAADDAFAQSNRDRAKRWAEANPERRFANLLRARYGITVEQYEGMLAAQDGRCATCRQPETKTDHRTGKPLRLHIDHCHSTGVIRGLLCSRCNLLLGLTGDDPTLLRALAEYLEEKR